MRLHHVSIPVRGEQFDVSRRFYGTLLELQELPPPESLDTGSFIWFRAGEAELHLYRDDDPGSTPLDRQHLCFEVNDLDDLRNRLVAADVPVEDAVAIHNRPRFFCRDPFGNRIEVTQILGEYQ